MSGTVLDVKHKIPEISSSELDRLSRFVREQVGISLGAHKHYLVQSRLVKRLKTLQCSSFSDYLDLALDPLGAECPVLLDMLTTNKTAFFREPVHFSFIEDVLLPEWKAARGGNESLRCWSAACSTGEEPYSMAMQLCESGLLPIDMSPILATDISDSALRCAMAGEYDQSLVQHLPKRMLSSYFRATQSGSLMLNDSLKNRVAFRKFNLVRGPYAFKHEFDLILCRNAMIYFESETRSWVIRHLTRALRAGGYLLIGHSESIDTKEHSELSMVAPTIYRRVTSS